MDLFEKYYIKAVHYLTHRPRSEKEVRDNLLKKKAPPDILDKVVATLTEQKYLNDADFVLWWLEQRAEFRPRSLRLLKIELRQKGISNDIMEAVLSDKSNEEIQVTDRESAKKIVDKKFEKYRGLPREVVYQKLGGFLGRRGYSWEVIKAVIDEAMAGGV